jgi:CxxC motif-containing protein (DUF1111 family)
MNARLRFLPVTWSRFLIFFALTTQGDARIALAEEQAAIDPVKAGAKWFTHQWQVNDPASRAGDGLGPMYNATSCAECRIGDIPRSHGTFPAFNPDLAKHPSVVLHRFCADEGYLSWREKQFSRVLDGTPTPSVIAEVCDAEGDDDVDVKPKARVRGRANVFSLSELNPTALFGAGLIDQIPDAVIRAQVKKLGSTDPLDTSPRPRISEPVDGRVVELADGRVGKFGWKARHASLADFSLTACAVELGLEVPHHPQNARLKQASYRAPGLDMNQADCDALVTFIAALPAPRRVSPPEINELVLVGETLFGRIGCADCHKSRLGQVDGIYSDLLVHEMGSALADAGSYSAFRQSENDLLATPSEWRTPPLWGVADSAPYLHDGRARTLKEAILLHEGQAERSADSFSALAEDDQLAVVAFLRSLRAPAPEQLIDVAQVESR